MLNLCLSDWSSARSLQVKICAKSSMQILHIILLYSVFTMSGKSGCIKQSEQLFYIPPPKSSLVLKLCWASVSGAYPKQPSISVG